MATMKVTVGELRSDADGLDQDWTALRLVAPDGLLSLKREVYWV